MSETMEKEIRNVKVPLTVDQIKEFFTNKDLIYFVNYKDSDLKGVVFLTYLSNLDLPAEINFEGASFEEKSELMKIYMETRNLISCETLRLNAAMILLENRGVDTESMILNPCFSNEERSRFVNDNSELVKKWEQFIESSIVFAQTTIPELEEKLGNKINLPQIDDQQFIGANVVNLFSIPSFYEIFLSMPNKHELHYFKPQFEEYMFRGKNFFSFYNCPENTVYQTFIAHVNGDISIKSIVEAGQEACETLQGE